MIAPASSLSSYQFIGDIHATDNYGMTPLHHAAINGHTETALMLINAGADLYAKDVMELTPLKYAAMYRSTKIARILEQAALSRHKS